VIDAREAPSHQEHHGQDIFEKWSRG
jgi:hypothetical protein